MKKLYGVDIELGESVLAYQTPKDRADAKAYLDRALGGETVTVESFAGDEEMSRRCILVEHNPIRQADGSIIGAAVYAHDLTERMRAEEALRESEAMRATAEQVAHVGSWRWVPATQQVTWSQEMYRLFDVDPGEFHGDFTPVLNARVHSDDRERLKLTIGSVTATGDPLPVEYRVVHRDGSERFLHGEGAVERDENGDVAAIVGYYQDVTEQRAAEAEINRLNAELEERVARRTAQLEAANKELEAFAYSVSHDLRAPLRAIDGFSLMVIEDAAERLEEADREHLQRVRRAAQRMALLIDELLEFSRAARKDMIRDDLDLGALATSVLEELREAHPGRRIELIVAPGMRATADPALLRIILVNLLDNAWKFTASHEEARIEVGVCDEGGERAFFVRDDGAGFDESRAQHLFGAFQRLHDADEFEGEGIGLATVQRLATRHGGRVWARTEVEKGATFCLTLPAPAASA
jgi:PAS domain S-box-containing protein